MHETDEKQYELRLVKSSVPFYVTGVVWFAVAVFSGACLWWHYLLMAVGAILLFAILDRLIPMRQVRVPRTRVWSGNTEVDAQIREADALLRRVEQYGSRIVAWSVPMASDIAGLTTDGDKILTWALKHPAGIHSLRRFLQYYLPTLEKLCASYLELQTHQTGEETRKEIESAVSSMRAVFARQLEKLLADYELDISTDIEVLENKLAAEKLSKRMETMK